MNSDIIYKDDRDCFVIDANAPRYNISDLINYTKKIVDSAKIAANRGYSLKYHHLNYISHIESIRYGVCKIENYEQKAFAKDVLDYIVDEWKKVHIGIVSSEEFPKEIWNILRDKRYIECDIPDDYFSDKVIIGRVTSRIISKPYDLASQLESLHIPREEIEAIVDLLEQAFVRGCDLIDNF